MLAFGPRDAGCVFWPAMKGREPGINTKGQGIDGLGMGQATALLGFRQLSTFPIRAIASTVLRVLQASPYYLPVLTEDRTFGHRGLKNLQLQRHAVNPHSLDYNGHQRQVDFLDRWSLLGLRAAVVKQSGIHHERQHEAV